MPKFLKRYFEKKEMIHDGGVHQKSTKIVDFFVILGCGLIIICLCVLGILAYANV